MFYRYLKEIKNRSILIITAWVLAVFVCYFYKEVLLFFLMKPFKKVSLYFIYTNLLELFSTYVQLSFFFGNLVLILFFMFHFLNFVSPGMFSTENSQFKALLFLCALTGTISFILVNKIFLPTLSEFFFLIHKSASTEQWPIYLEAKIYEYLNIYILIYYIFFMCFSFFIILFYYLKLESKTLILLRKFRKFFYFGTFIFATAITPPDIFCQCFLSLMFIIVFEILLFFNVFSYNLDNYKII